MAAILASHRAPDCPAHRMLGSKPLRPMGNVSSLSGIIASHTFTNFESAALSQLSAHPYHSPINDDVGGGQNNRRGQRIVRVKPYAVGPQPGRATEA